MNWQVSVAKLSDYRMDVCWIKPINAYRIYVSGMSSWQCDIHRGVLNGLLCIISVTGGKKAKFWLIICSLGLHKYWSKWEAIRGPNCAAAQWHYLGMTAWTPWQLMITGVLSWKVRELILVSSPDFLLGKLYMLLQGFVWFCLYFMAMKQRIVLPDSIFLEAHWLFKLPDIPLCLVFSLGESYKDQWVSL